MGDFVSNPARTLTPIGGNQALSELTQAVLDLRAALSGTLLTVTFLDHNQALPTASAGLHGKIYVISMGSPGGDQAYWCLRSDRDLETYVWVGLASV